MGAAQHVDIPGYSALLLRKAFSDLILPGALMDRAHEWWDEMDCDWNEQNHIWTFPCPKGGVAKIAFGYMEHENDKLRYKSAQFNYIGFDELTDFTEGQFQFMFSRVRRLQGSGIPGRVRSASNPGGPGHEWVYNRYILPAESGEMPPGRFFIRALLSDNPHLDQDDYIDSLAFTDLETRRQILEGDWTYRPEGNKFKRQWLEGHFLAMRPPLKMAVRYWDLASTVAGKGKNPDWTRGALLGLGEQNQVVVCDMRSIRGTPGEVEDLIVETAEFDKVNLDCRYFIRMEQEPGSSGVNTIDHYQREVLQGYDFDGNRSTGKKEERFNAFASQAEHGNVYVLAGAWVEAYLTELESFPNPRYKDDQVDATSGAYEFLASKIRHGRPGIRVF